jgi:hypothetical protein
MLSAFMHGYMNRPVPGSSDKTAAQYNFGNEVVTSNRNPTLDLFVRLQQGMSKEFEKSVSALTGHK